MLTLLIRCFFEDHEWNFQLCMHKLHMQTFTLHFTCCKMKTLFLQVIILYHVFVQATAKKDEGL